MLRMNFWETRLRHFRPSLGTVPDKDSSTDLLPFVQHLMAGGVSGRRLPRFSMIDAILTPKRVEFTDVSASHPYRSGGASPRCPTCFTHPGVCLV